MYQAQRRIAWLLNHRTLMPYEADLIRRLGFEVFIPKVIPAGSGFRSGAVSYEFDDSLTIPARHLRYLNEVDLYHEEWNTSTVKLLNRYFETAFVMTHGVCLREAVEKFEGRVVLRTFGLEGAMRYADVIEHLHSIALLRSISAMGDRFVFGEGYDNLHLIEPDELGGRAAYLPIGAPVGLLAEPPAWRNADRRILLSCPSIAGGGYYGRLYTEFRSQFADLPYVISGVQEQPVDDPNVLGFVETEELKNLYQTCSVLYYPSREPRHIHYTPVEAVVAGQPVVFYRGSLLDRLTGGTARGGVDTPAEARALMVRLLDGDAELAGQLVNDQRRLRHVFEDSYCTTTWRATLTEIGIDSARSRSRLATALREARRTVLLPVAHGRVSTRPTLPAPLPPASLDEAGCLQVHGATLRQGIDLSKDVPDFVEGIDGVGPPEIGGRWVVGPSADIALRHTLPPSFRLAIEAFPAPGVDTVDVAVQVGRRTRTFTIDRSKSAGVSSRILSFDDVASGHSLIRVRPRSEQARSIGVSRIKQLAALTPFDEIDSRPGAEIARIDFADPDLSSVVDAAQGLSGWEGWGRWTDGTRAQIELRHSVSGSVIVRVAATALPPTASRPVAIRLGRAGGQVMFGTSVTEATSDVELTLAAPSNLLVFDLPLAGPTPDDPRHLGLALRSITLCRAARSR